MAVLEAQHLVVQFGEHAAVRDVSLSVDAGTIVGLIGPNGAGKTTTFNAIAGVQKCRGTVHLDGVDVSKAPPHRRASLGHEPHLPAARGVRLDDGLRQHPHGRGDRQPQPAQARARRGSGHRSRRGAPRPGLDREPPGRRPAHRAGPSGRARPGAGDRPEGRPARRARLGPRRGGDRACSRRPCGVSWTMAWRCSWSSTTWTW